MGKCVTVIVCALVLFGCQQKSGGSRPGLTTRVQPTDASKMKVNEVIQPVPQFIDHAAFGSELNASGVVAKENLSIPEGSPAYLTMVFRESPAGLQASAVWTRVDKTPVSTERKEMNGAKAVTFTLSQKLKPGHYKVVGYWGGNIAAERDFEVVGKRKKG
jgi:methionine-rich copper-binding protein CopC